jgi:hypothetical protein
VASSAVTAQKPEATDTIIKVVSIDTLIKAQAQHYAISEIHLQATINCESSENDDAVGDHGLAYGVAQFHEVTFDWMKQKAIKEGEPFQNLEYKNPSDQITLMAWAFSVGLASNWSCYTHLKQNNWQQSIV